MKQKRNILELASECRSKRAWDVFVQEHADKIQNTVDISVITHIFSQLQKDSLSLNYNPALWQSLITGALNCHQVQMALEISDYSRSIQDPELLATICQAELTAQKTDSARKTAKRGLRLSESSHFLKTRLLLCVAQSYSQEQNTHFTQKYCLATIKELSQISKNPKEYASIHNGLGRIYFLTGHYKQAGKHFLKASELFTLAPNWNETTRSIYNAASSFYVHYCGRRTKGKYDPFRLIEKCKSLSEEHSIQEAGCFFELFYGYHDYANGRFYAAREHYRRAFQYLPANQRGIRDVRILGLLTEVYLKCGQNTLASRFADRAAKIAARSPQELKDEPMAIHTKAELAWQLGQMQESHNILVDGVDILQRQALSRFDQLQAASRVIYQGALLGDHYVPAGFTIAKHLKRPSLHYTEYLLSQSFYYLTHGQLAKAESTLLQTKDFVDNLESIYLQAKYLLCDIQIQYAHPQFNLTEMLERLDEFAFLTSNLVETPLRNHLYFAKAAISYRSGDLEQCHKTLSHLSSKQTMFYEDRLASKAWLNTLVGHAARIHDPLKEHPIALLSKIYFAPSVVQMDEENYLISNYYQASLSENPQLAKLMNALFTADDYTLSLTDIQKHVWEQSIDQVGWQQKIRNSLNRLRKKFAPTVAPLVIHQDDIRLFSSGIILLKNRSSSEQLNEEIITLLKDAPYSTEHLTQKLDASPATIKRKVRQLRDQGQITMVKIGRNVLYQAI